MNRELLDDERIFTIAGLLAPDECEQHIQRSEAIGFEVFTIDGDVYPGFRNNSRIVFDDADLAESLWQRVRAHVPATLDSLDAVGLNPRFRYYRYKGDEAFAPHHDGHVRIEDHVSKLTFMVYLNDVAAGGETRFYDDALNVRFGVRPEQGKALIFEHAALHEGVALEDGTKYVLRSDIMYG